MKNNISPFIENNIRNLSHDRYLQKSHTWINLGLAVWLAFMAILATWVIDGNKTFNFSIILISAMGTSIIGSFSYSLYWISMKERKKIINKIALINYNSS